jgi:hypothetical protein
MDEFKTSTRMMVLPITHQAVDADIELARSLGCPSHMPLILGGHDHEPFDIAVGGDSDDDDCDGFIDSSSGNKTKCRLLKAGIDAERAIVIDVVWPSAEVAAPDIDVEFVPLARAAAGAAAAVPPSLVPAKDADASDGAAAEAASTFDPPGEVDGGGVISDEECTIIEPCPDLERQVRRYQEPLLRLDRTVLKALERRDVSLTSVGVRQGQTSMGALICTALRKALRADAAILNGGCLRGNTVYTMPAAQTESAKEAVGRREEDGARRVSIAGREGGGAMSDQGTGRDFNNRREPSSDQHGDASSLDDVAWSARKFFTFGDLIRELPFETEICVVNLPGSVLEEAIHQSRHPERYGCRRAAYLQVCNELDVELCADDVGVVDDKNDGAGFGLPRWKITSIDLQGGLSAPRTDRHGQHPPAGGVLPRQHRRHRHLEQRRES